MKAGTCAECGCTDDRAWWVDREHTICSACLAPLLAAPDKAALAKLLRKVKSRRLLVVAAQIVQARVKNLLARSVKIRARFDRMHKAESGARC